MHVFKLHGQDKTQASWLPVCSSQHKELLGCGWAPADLAWSGKGSPCRSQRGHRPWLGQASSSLICGQGSGALCLLPTPVCHVIPDWTV